MNQQTMQKNGFHKERAFHKTNVLPPLDVYENNDELLVVIDIPGVTADTLTISVEGEILKFEAHPPAYEPPAGSRALALDLGPQTFERVLKVPPGIDASRISAETKNGTVVLHMPKLEKARPRRIPVKGT